MDELKDHQKDALAHPDRPLPRGLITVPEARRAVLVIVGVAGLYAGVSTILTNVPAGTLYAVAVTYLWLMYREFYVGAWLERRLMAYALSHQLVLVPILGFAIAASEPAAAFARRGLAYTVANLGVSLAHELGRKLDPRAPAILGHYVAEYGATRSALLVAGCTALAATGAYALGAGGLLWPVEGIVMASLVAFLASPDRHSLVKATTAVASLIHLWSIPLLRAWQWLT